MRREGASSPTVPPPPLPLDTHSEEERRDGKEVKEANEGVHKRSWGEVGGGVVEVWVGRGKRRKRPQKG